MTITIEVLLGKAFIAAKILRVAVACVSAFYNQNFHTAEAGNLRVFGAELDRFLG